MSTIGELTAGIGLNIGPLQKGATSATSELNKMASNMDAALSRINSSVNSLDANFGKGVNSIVGAIQSGEGKIGKSSTGIIQSLGSVKSIVATLGAGLSVGALGKSILDVNVAFDKMQASLETVTGSKDLADQAFAGLKEFAKETPYQLGEVTGAYIKMRAVGMDASRSALTSYGNTASAMSKSLDQMIEAVADAQRGEFERLKEFGIKASKQGENVTFTFQNVATKVGFNAQEIEKYLQGIGKTQFAGGMIRQMDTLGGKLSNLSDAWDAAMRKIGDAGATSAMKGSVESLTKMIESASNSLPMFIDGIERIGKVLVVSGGVASLPFIFAGVAKSIGFATLALAEFNLVVKTGGIMSALTTPLFGASIAAQLAAKEITKLQIAGQGMIALYAGWQLGDYLYDNFETARLAGLGFVDGVMKGFINLEYGVKTTWNAISSGWNFAIDSMMTVMADFLEWAGTGLDSLPFVDGVASSLSGVVESLREGANNSKSFADSQEELNKKFQEQVKLHEATIELVRKSHTEKKKEKKIYHGELPNSPVSKLNNPPGVGTDKLKGVNLNAQVDLAKDLDWHFREIVGDISAEEKALKAVDAIIDRQVKDLKAIGLGEKDILKIRTQAHQKELAILKSKEEMADVVKKVKELEKGGMIYGDDYGTLKEGEQSQWSVSKELDDDALEKFVDLADEIGASFADAFLTGFEGGLDGLGDVLKGVLEDQVFSSISKSISKSIQNSLANSKFLSSFGPALGSIAGGVVGAGLGEIGKMITGSSKSDQKRKEERALIKELYHNTKATERNTARLVAGETSSYTSPLSDVTAGFQDMAVDLRAKFKGGLSFGLGSLIKDLEGVIGSMKINAVFKSMLEGFENGFSNINSMISEFSKMSDVDNLHNKTKAGLNSIIASLEEFAAEIDNVQKDIFKSLRASWEEAGDAFRTEGEVSRRGMEEAGKDYLLGLAETFKLEGTSIGTEWKELFGGIKLPQTKYMDDAYIEELSKLTSVQEISQKLLKDLIPGTDAYNKAMEASLIIYETSRLKAKATQTDILASVNDMWVSTADTFKTEAQRTQEEVEKQGREFLLGLADSYGMDVKDLDKLKNVNEITNQLLKDLVPGTEEYNQVMEASVKIYDTAIMKQKSMVSGLESSISSWKDDLIKRNWGKSEWVGEFETIGRSIEGLNVLSDTYFSDALSLSEKQFDALKQIVSFSEAQLLELQNSSKSLSEQLWEFSKGGEADAISSKDWMSRGEGLYLTAEKTLNPEDIQEFQQFLPELRDAMLSAGYSNSYVTEQFQWALSTLLDKVNVAMADVESNIDKLPELAPSVQTQQPIQIMLNVDGKQLSNVIIDQLNTNTNLIKAVQRID